MAFEHQVLELIELAYESVASADAWPAFLQRFAAALNGVFPIIFIQPKPGGPADRPTIVAADIPASYLQEYRDYYASRNVLLINGSRFLSDGRVRTGEMMCSTPTLLASEFYNDFLRPMDARYSLGGTISSDGARSCNVSLFRGHRGVPFDEEDLRLLGALLPHLRRAIDLHARLGDLDDRRGWHAESLDQLSLGVVCLGPRGEVRHANRMARSILEKKDGLAVERGVLRAATPALTASLHALVSSIAQSPPAQGTRGDSLALPRFGRRPLEAVVLPARICSQSSRCRTAAFMFISDPERAPAPLDARLRRLYNFTAAEARVVGGLLRGEALEEIAERSDTSLHTVRTQVKRAFEKTGTNRQAELLRLVGRWSLVEAGDHEPNDSSHAARADR